MTSVPCELLHFKWKTQCTSKLQLTVRQMNLMCGGYEINYEEPQRWRKSDKIAFFHPLKRVKTTSIPKNIQLIALLKISMLSTDLMVFCILFPLINWICMDGWLYVNLFWINLCIDCEMPQLYQPVFRLMNLFAMRWMCTVHCSPPSIHICIKEQWWLMKYLRTY